MVRLRAVADIVTHDADVAQDQGLATQAVGAVPGLALHVRLALFGGVQHAPIGEVAAQLLPAVDHGVGQIAGVVDAQAGLGQGGVVFRFQARQVVDAHAALVEDPALVVQVDEVGGVAFAIVRLAGALPAVGFARQFAHVGDGGRGAQEGGQVVGQGPHRRHPDQSVAGVAPGGDGDGGRDDGEHGHGGDGETFHETDLKGEIARSKSMIGRG